MLKLKDITYKQWREAIRFLLLMIFLFLTGLVCGTSVYVLRADGPWRGNYLSAIQATQFGDFHNAAVFFRAVLKEQPHSISVLGNALLFSLLDNDTRHVKRLARRAVDLRADHPLARFIRGAQALKQGDTRRARKEFTRVGQGHPILYQCSRSGILWSLDETEQSLGEQQVETLTGRFARVPSLLLQAALHYERLDNPQAAEENYRRAISLSGTQYPHYALAFGNFLERQGRWEEAQILYKKYISHPVILAVLEHPQDTPPPPLITSPPQGLAYCFLDHLWRQEHSSLNKQFNLGFSRVMLLLAPERGAAHLALGKDYQSLKLWKQALAAYQNVPADSLWYTDALLSAAQALKHMEREEDALSLLQEALLNTTLTPILRAELLIAIGNIHSMEDRDEEAIAAYTEALQEETSLTPWEKTWFVYFLRGSAYERLKQWPSAEQDFKQALALSKDNPMVLNALGYSWADRGKNLQEALKMLKSAVRQRSHEGYIVDSLGWVYYRLGAYDDAVFFLERAVELAPGDPVINDHLGDALWAKKRYLEARFQWERALSLEPEEELAPLIQRKLLYGFDSKAGGT